MSHRQRKYQSRSKSSARTERDAGLTSFAASAKQVSNLDVNFDHKDLTNRPPGFNLTQQPPRNLSNQIFWAKQGAQATLTLPAAGLLQYTKSFTLNDVYDGGNFAKIFDQYCIYAVAISFSPAATSTVTQVGTIYTVIDYTDLLTLGSSSEALSYSTSRSMALSPGDSHLRVIKPCVSQAIYQSLGVSSYGPSRVWIDIASPNVPHFGIKVYADGASTTTLIAVNIEYLFGFRSSK